MRQDVIRFGSKHRLREAVWLLREARRHGKEMTRLYLQGDDARIAGAVDLRLVLGQFLEAGRGREPAESAGEAPTEGPDFYRFAWERIHRRRLRVIAETGPVTVLPTARLSEVRDVMLRYGIDEAPVTRDGRILGRVVVRDVLEALLESQGKGQAP